MALTSKSSAIPHLKMENNVDINIIILVSCNTSLQSNKNRVSNKQIKNKMIQRSKLNYNCFYRWCYYFEAEVSNEHQINLVPQLLFIGTQDFETGMMMYNAVKIKND